VGGQDLSAALGAVVGFALGFMLVRWHAWHHRNDRALQPTLLDVVEPPPAQAVNLV
jgi:sigma-E factor negative regulatory protein RseC